MASVRINADCDSVVAHLPGVVEAVASEARGGARRAEAILSGHHRTGAAHITVTHGVTDSFVNLVDPGGAAAAIEFGHTTKQGRGVEGIHAITGAFW
jgi:hypothetical protein